MGNDRDLQSFPASRIPMLDRFDMEESTLRSRAPLELVEWARGELDWNGTESDANRTS